MRVSVQIVITPLIAVSVGFGQVQIVRATPDAPQTAKEYLERGIECSDRGDYFAAVEDFSRALTLDPNHPLLYYNRAVALSCLRQYDAAISDYTNSIKGSAIT